MATDPEIFDIDKPQEVLDAERNPDNAGNEIAIAAKRRNKKQQDEERNEGLKIMLSSKAGREYLAYILFDVCGLMGPSASKAFDDNSLHYREGAKEVARIVQKDALQVNRAAYMVLLDEHLR